MLLSLAVLALPHQELPALQPTTLSSFSSWPVADVPSDACGISSVTGPKLSTSQFQQDLWALQVNGCKRGGYYVDIGANNGVHISNTYVLDHFQGWRGLCVDAFPVSTI